MSHDERDAFNKRQERFNRVVAFNISIGENAMEFLQVYGKEIVSLIAPILTWVINYIFKAKVKLQVALPHQFTFLVQQPFFDADGKELSPTQTVHTNSFIIRNAGQEPASKVELVFNWKPMCLNIWPVRHYEEYIEPDRRYILIFDSLAPDEALGIEVLSINHDLPKLVTVRSTQCIAQNINMYPQPDVSIYVRRISAVLIFMGLSLAIYFLIVLVQLLVLRTPLGH